MVAVDLDQDRGRRVERLARALKDAADANADVRRAEAVDVMLAYVVRAVAVAKVLGVEEDNFFDVVVRLFEWTTLEKVDRH